MTKRLTMLAAVITIFGCMAYAASTSMVGVVSDSKCGLQHSKASDAAASCVKSCVASGSKYVLVSHGKVYQVDKQSDFEPYAGREVRVHGHVKGDSIAVTSVAAVHMGHHHTKHSSSGGM